MEEFRLIIGFVQSIGFTGLLIILAIPKTRTWLGFGNNNEILEHLQEYYNHDLTSSLGSIETKLNKLDSHLDDIRTNGVRIRK